MMERIAGASPRLTARMAGAFWLLTILAGIFSQGYVARRLLVTGDAAATAVNILAHRHLLEAGFAVYLVEMASQVSMTALFYELLKPAGRILSLVMAFLSLTGCVIKTFARVFFVAPLLVLGGVPYLNVFSGEQLQALALLLLEVNEQGGAMALVYFGFATLLKGCLVLRSTFLPRLLGVLALLGGAGWLSFLYPPVGYRLFPAIAAVGLLGSAAWIVWLLVFGVNEQRWREQAGGAGTGV